MNTHTHAEPTSGLIAHLRAQGVDTARTHLVATVALLPSGTKFNYSGQQVQVFTPVATDVLFLTEPGPNGRQFAALRYDAPLVTRSESGILLDDEDFDRHVLLDGMLAHSCTAAAGRLMRKLVSEYREIIGEINSAFEHIEVDAKEIRNITAKRFTLSIGLERLAKYVALDDEGLDLLLGSDSPQAQSRLRQIAFEKLMLKEGFIKQPCTQELYEELRQEFIGQGYSIGMDFMDYYQWFRRSENLLDADGNITGETRDDMAKAVHSWRDTGGDKPNFLETALYWACRNFGIHPRHHAAAERLIDEITREKQPTLTPETPSAADHEFTDNIDEFTLSNLRPG